MDLSVILVSYRSPALLLAGLRALRADAGAAGLALEVVVVDNDSGDGTLEALEPRAEERRENGEKHEMPRPRPVGAEQRERYDQREEQQLGTGERGEEQREPEERRASGRPRRVKRGVEDDERHEDGERRLHSDGAPANEPSLRGDDERGCDGRRGCAVEARGDPVDEHDRSDREQPREDAAPDENIRARAPHEGEQPHPEGARRPVRRIGAVEGKLAVIREVSRVLKMYESVVDDGAAQRHEEAREEHGGDADVCEILYLHGPFTSDASSAPSRSASARRLSSGTSSSA